MLLSARILYPISTVNNFQPASQFQMTEGDKVDIYFQIIDMSIDRNDQGFVPAGRRYIPATGATLSVLLDNVDDAKQITKTATNPFPGDTSIWKISINSTDAIMGTVNMKLTLTEGSTVTKGVFWGAIGVTSLEGLC